MPIIVEDGSGVTGANSFNSVSDLDSYAADRGVTITSDEEVLLIKSMDYIVSQNYSGTRVSSTQELPFPRSGVVIDGYTYPSNVIPKELKLAQLATCLSIEAGVDPMATIDQGIKRVKADVVEIEYQDDTSATSVIPSITRYLAPLLSGSSSGTANFRVSRA